MADESVEKLISLGANVSGSVAGAGVGLMVAGPAGAVAGAVTAPVATAVIDTAGDFVARQLSSREGAKIGAAFGHAIDRLEWRLTRGEPLRNDGFFEDRHDARARSKELLEGILLRCRNEHEEKKLKHLGYIFANAAFTEDAPGSVNYILEVCSRLSFRQISILALLSGMKNSQSLYPDAQRRELAMATDRTLIGLYETDTMGPNAMLMHEYSDLCGPLFPLVDKSLLALLPLGKKCAELMGLETFSEIDLVDLRKQFFELMPDQHKPEFLDVLGSNRMLHKLGRKDDESRMTGGEVL